MAAEASPPLPLSRRLRTNAWRALRLAIVCSIGAPMLLRAADSPAPGTFEEYRYCAVCHGAALQGNNAIQAPALAGIEDWYLKARLQAYRSQQLGHDFAADPAGTEMRIVARELGDEKLADIARYVAGFRNVAPATSVSGNASTGRRLYMAQCATCHGARGEGNAQLHAPGLARLNDWYLVSAWGKYRSGLRGAQGSDPYAQQMRALAEALGPDLAINDIAAYLRSRSH